MYSPHTSFIQKNIRQWVDLDRWLQPFAATLTLKQRISIYGDLHSSSVSLTPDLASQNLKHFLNVLNKRVYGASAQRHGKNISVLSVIEGGNSKRLHYHLALDCPRDDLVEVFPDLVAQIWRSTQWGYHETCVTPCDGGWVTYMTKLRDKPDFADAIDWMNTHNPN